MNTTHGHLAPPGPEAITTIIGWILSAALAFIFLGSAWSKLMQGEEALETAASIHIKPDDFFIIGIVELSAILLFLIPRTAVLGTLLLVAYMGGAIATHLEYAKPLAFPIIISCLVWITAILRLPELSQRIFSYPTNGNNKNFEVLLKSKGTTHV